MSKLLFKFRDSIKYLISINEMDIYNSEGKAIFREEYIEWPKPFHWIKKVERRIINDENKVVAIIGNKSILVEKKEWYLRQTQKNDYHVREQKISDSHSNDVEFPELGQWELRNMARVLKFDGVKFIENDSIVRGTVRLHASSKLLFDTYCKLKWCSSNDYLIFAFLISIMHRYAEYMLMGHDVWTV